MTTRSAPYEKSLAWVRRAVTDGPLPVAVFGVATSTGIQEIASFGSDKGRVAGVDDQFALFSVTKPLTALTALRLVEAGELSLDAQLAEAVPTLSGENSGLATLEHLLSHRSGLADPDLDGTDPRDTLARIGGVFPAGTMTQYCNLGFVGVEKLMEHASARANATTAGEVGSGGRSFEAQFAALNEVEGVSTLGFDPDRDPHFVHGTESVGLDHSRLVEARHPAAGAYAKASDLLSLGSALLRTVASGSSEVVHPSTLAAMRVNRTAGLPRLNSRADDAQKQDWGLGFNLPTSSAILDRNLFGHAGWSGCQWWIYPELDACFVLLTNLIDLPGKGVRIDELQNAFASGLR
ncbi:beta-lactamase family protein [Subtercola sp. PAMC28395]|uniref:serine hydrolase domain-containing protein n=1 Tax=Subtercola sp. PAMC28395 TaxID=2846775 RepID=UPI001C0E4975|nr:serine hydrolase domain-containing protein [Subtercola sp. PAMC28395]QWT24141.1 beta-lactamase family protein [Subtercola sp. PAMC28395]